MIIQKSLKYKVLNFTNQKYRRLEICKHIWDRLVELSKVPNTVAKGFKYGKTFEEVEKQVDRYIDQIKIDI